MKEKRANSILKILEIFWMIVGILAFMVSVYSIVTGNQGQALYFLAFGIVAGLMYLVRKKQRKIHMKGLEKDLELEKLRK